MTQEIGKNKKKTKQSVKFLIDLPSFARFYKTSVTRPIESKLTSHYLFDHFWQD